MRLLCILDDTEDLQLTETVLSTLINFAISNKLVVIEILKRDIADQLRTILHVFSELQLKVCLLLRILSKSRLKFNENSWVALTHFLIRKNQTTKNFATFIINASSNFDLKLSFSILQNLFKHQSAKTQSQLIKAQSPWFNKHDALQFIQQGGWKWLFDNLYQNESLNVFRDLAELLRNTDEIVTRPISEVCSVVQDQDHQFFSMANRNYLVFLDCLSQNLIDPMKLKVLTYELA